MVVYTRKSSSNWVFIRTRRTLIAKIPRREKQNNGACPTDYINSQRMSTANLVYFRIPNDESLRKILPVNNWTRDYKQLKVDEGSLDFWSPLSFNYVVENGQCYRGRSLENRENRENIYLCGYLKINSKRREREASCGACDDSLVIVHESIWSEKQFHFSSLIVNTSW